MEQREIIGIPLKVINDEIFKVTYVRFLSQTSLETIKLPTNLQDYKFGHLISPNYLLHIEVIKTKKNWILKDVLASERIANPNAYQDFLKQSEVVKLLLEYMREDQEISILPFLQTQMSQLTTLDLLTFESQLLEELGFIPQFENQEDISTQLQKAKIHSGLL